jgi:hypothetical protein
MYVYIVIINNLPLAKGSLLPGGGLCKTDLTTLW